MKFSTDKWHFILCQFTKEVFKIWRELFNRPSILNGSVPLRSR